jgi:membrane protein YqaA with SNARE-associated domain
MNEPPAPASHSQTSSFWTGKLFRFLVVVIVLVCSISIFAFRERFTEWAAFGYSGIFLVSLLSSATIVLPAPSLAVVFAMGSALPWLPVGLAAEDQKGYEPLAAWMQKRGGITIFVLSVIPNPLFDLAGIAAGTLRYPVWRFLLFTWLGKTLKTSLVAWAGSQSITLVEQFLR